MNVFAYFLSRYTRQTVMVLLCLLLASVLEGLGLTALFPVLSILASDSGTLGGPDSSFLERSVASTLGNLGLAPEIWEWFVFLGVLFWLKSGLVLFANNNVGYTVARVATDLRLGVLRALMTANWGYYTRLQAGVASNALATEAERGSLTYHHMSQVIGFATESAIYISIAFAISARITGAALAAALFILVALVPLVRMAGRAGRKQTKFLKSLASQVTDGLQAVKLLKATGRENLIEPLLERDTVRLNRALRRRVFSREALKALQEPIIVTAGLAGIYVGTRASMPFAELALMGALFARCIDSSNKMQRKYQSMVTESSALWSIHGMIESAASHLETMTEGRAPTLDRSIEMRGVCVAFDGAQVLDDLSLTIRAGEVTALIGESGSGKTTTVDLVTGLVRPDAGDVLIDGVPLKQIDLRRWRNMIGYVPQEMLMLHDSIERNVSLGDPEVSEADVVEALRKAGAWDFVSALPNGIRSSVGERGALLSGGQRQRIAIARALVHGAGLLILDEATAALDRDSEAVVWDAIERLRGKTTVIAISHQPALRGIADRVYRIAGGRAEPVEPVRGSASAGAEEPRRP